MKRLVALGGTALFFLSCALVRGGLFDKAHYGDAELYGIYAHRMASGEWPYRDFFDEYPVLAQPLFYVVKLLPGPFITSFRWTMAACGAAALVLMVEAMRGPLHRVVVAAAVAGVSPLLVGPVFINTYDLFPALLTIAAVLAFLRSRGDTPRHKRVTPSRRAPLNHALPPNDAPHRRLPGGHSPSELAGYVLLALAVAAKVYPLAVLPLALVETWGRGGRLAVRRALAWFVGVLVLVHLPFAIMGPGGLRFSYWVQVKRGLESESLGGGVLLVLDRLGIYSVTLRDKAPGSRDAVGTLPDVVAALSSLAVVAAVLAVGFLYLRGRRDLLVGAAAAVTAFVAFNKVLSPQYVAWLVPLVPAAGVVASGVLVAALALTHVVFDRFGPHGSIEHWGQVLSWWIFARDLVLVALFALLASRLRAGARPRSLP